MLTNHALNEPFHHDLKTIAAVNAGRHNALAFLCSALSPVRTAAQLPSDVDLPACQWEQVFALACGGLVAPLLYARIRQKQLEAYSPADFVEALQVIHAANQQRNSAYRQILLEAITTLNQAGITPVLLKGAHALAGLMPDHAERIVSDIDLLILDDKVLEAKAALLAAGFFQAIVKSEYSWVEHSDADPDHHHLAPLYHPTLNGYVELHRHPHYSPHYPRLLDECFVPNQLLHSEQEGAVFYYQHEWQRLLYNQIHHYHACFVSGKLDIRHLAEQSALLAAIGHNSEWDTKIPAVFGKQAMQSYDQFVLLQRLFAQSAPVRKTFLSRHQDQRLDHAIACLLGNKSAKSQQRRATLLALFPYVLRQMGNRQWLKQRMFNLDWYRTRPSVLRHVITKNIKLH